MRGTPEQFNLMLHELVRITKQYEARQINHVKFFDSLDVLFANNGWSKQAFYKEMNAQLGIAHNERKVSNGSVKPKVKKKSVKKKETVAVPPVAIDDPNELPF